MSQDEALVVLQSMFLSVDKEIVSAVLQAHKGDVESSIESLLSISNAAAVPQSQDQTPVLIPDDDTLLIYQAQQEEEKQHENQIHQDELVALQLQNELFTTDSEPTTQDNNEVILKDIKEKVGKFSEAAKSKCKEFWQRLSSNNSIATPSKAIDIHPHNNEASADRDSDLETKPRYQNIIDDSDNSEVESSPQLIDHRRARRTNHNTEDSTTDYQL